MPLRTLQDGYLGNRHGMLPHPAYEWQTRLCGADAAVPLPLNLTWLLILAQGKDFVGLDRYRPLTHRAPINRKRVLRLIALIEITHESHPNQANRRT